MAVLTSDLSVELLARPRGPPEPQPLTSQKQGGVAGEQNLGSLVTVSPRIQCLAPHWFPQCLVVTSKLSSKLNAPSCHTG